MRQNIFLQKSPFSGPSPQRSWLLLLHDYITGGRTHAGKRQLVRKRQSRTLNGWIVRVHCSRSDSRGWLLFDSHRQRESDFPVSILVLLLVLRQNITCGWALVATDISPQNIVWLLSLINLGLAVKQFILQLGIQPQGWYIHIQVTKKHLAFCQHL